MEALLRRGTGRYSEWVGAAALKADMLARQLDTAGASQRDYAALDPASRAMLPAYAHGVNRFIASGTFPLEYGLLKTTPATWLAWHSIAVMRQIGFLMGSVWWKLWRATALPIIGVAATSKLRFDDSGDELLCLPPGLCSGPYIAALADLQPGIQALLGEAPQDASGGGTGFPHFAHNGSVAWCVTHAFMDIHDLYVERFSSDGAASQFKDQWEPVQRRGESIAIQGEADREIEVLSTRHVPIIAGDPKTGTALALRSVQFDGIDRSFSCLLPMLKSKSVSELYEACREWGLIDHNLLAADTQGHIGHRVRAKVPLRPSSNGWLPVPGWTGEHEWAGMVPFERMPNQVDPPKGVLVTANNRVVSQGPDYLSTDAMPPHRARRIWERLNELELAKVCDMAALHRDVLSTPGVEFRDRLRRFSVAFNESFFLH
jgi:penicillin G amidase